MRAGVETGASILEHRWQAGAEAGVFALNHTVLDHAAGERVLQLAECSSYSTVVVGPA